MKTRIFIVVAACLLSAAAADLSIAVPNMAFEINADATAARFAFTFHNPLVAADILRFLKEKS